MQLYIRKPHQQRKSRAKVSEGKVETPASPRNCVADLQVDPFPDNGDAPYHRGKMHIHDVN